MPYQYVAQLPEVYQLDTDRLEDLDNRFELLPQGRSFECGDLSLDEEDQLVFLPETGWRPLLRQLGLAPSDFFPVAVADEEGLILLSRGERPLVKRDRRFKDCHDGHLDNSGGWSGGEWDEIEETIKPLARRFNLTFRVSYHASLDGCVPVCRRRQIDVAIGALPRPTETAKVTVSFARDGRLELEDETLLREPLADRYWLGLPVWSIRDLLSNVVAQVIGRSIYVLVDIFTLETTDASTYLAWLLEQTVPIVAAGRAEQGRLLERLARQRATVCGERAFWVGWLAGHPRQRWHTKVLAAQQRAVRRLAGLNRKVQAVERRLADISQARASLMGEQSTAVEQEAERLLVELEAISRFPLVTTVEMRDQYLVVVTQDIISARLRDRTRRNFGRLRCFLSLTGGGNRVESLDGPVRNYVHPHVSDGSLCLGNYRQPIMEVHLPKGELALAVSFFSRSADEG